MESSGDQRVNIVDRYGVILGLESKQDRYGRMNEAKDVDNALVCIRTRKAVEKVPCPE